MRTAKPRLTVRCLGWYTDASKTARVHAPRILMQGDPGAPITDTICLACRDAFLERAAQAHEGREHTDLDGGTTHA